MASGDDRAIGPGDFVEQPERRDKANGQWRTIRRWQGHRATVDAKVTELEAALLPDTMAVDKSPLATIEVSIGGIGDATPTPEDTAIWELLGQDLDKPLATHPYYNWNDVGIQALCDAALEDADDAIRSGTARQIAWATKYAAAYHIQHYVDMRLRGLDSYVMSSYIVRKSVPFRSTAAYRAEFTNANQIPGKVIAWGDIGIPTSAKFAAPKVHTWDRGADTWIDLALDQWLVKAPSVRWQKGRRLWEVTREYWGAEKWPKYIYEGGTYEP